MFNIVKNEIWDRRMSLLAYCLIGIGLLVTYIALFPSLRATSDQLTKLIATYPKGLFKAFGITNLSFNTVDEFLAVKHFSFTWPLIALALAMSRAGSTIAGEIEKGTMALYLSLPLSRIKIYFSKYLGGVLSLTLFVILTVFSIIPLAAIFNQSVNLKIILELSLLSLLFTVAVYSLTICLSAFYSERSKVYMIAGGLFLIMYVANVVSTLKTSLAWLHNFSAFYFFDAQTLLNNGNIKSLSIIVFGLSIIIFTAIGAVIFKRRDIAN